MVVALVLFVDVPRHSFYSLSLPRWDLLAYLRAHEGGERRRFSETVSRRA